MDPTLKVMISKPGDVPFDRAYWVEPGKLLAGCYPGDTDLAIATSKFEGLARVGIRSVVNLMELTETSWDGRSFVPYDADLASRGVAIFRMPIRDMTTPSLQSAIEILDRIDSEIANGRLVYVHCWGGQGRTGTIIGCSLVRHGIAQPQHAVRLIVSLRANSADAHKPSPQTQGQIGLIEGWREGL